MRSIMRAILILALVGTVSTSRAITALAQTPPRIERLHIDLWPEFDEPEMLVIFRGQLSADTPLPATVTLRLPARVDDPYAVAYQDQAGELLTAPYTTALTEEGLMVTLETPEPNFQLEFYDRLQRLEEQRNYSFAWSSQQPVDQLDILLLPPPGASDVQTDPPLSPVERGDNAFSYAGSVGGLAAGQEAQLTVSYRGAAVSVGVTTSTSDEGAGGRPDLPIIVGAALLALALVIAAGVWYTRRARLQTVPRGRSPRRRSKGRRRSAEPEATARPASRGSYCTQCGHSLRPGDRFCSQCGAPVKSR